MYNSSQCKYASYMYRQFSKGLCEIPDIRVQSHSLHNDLASIITKRLN
jgi:hypothetical protein